MARNDQEPHAASRKPITGPTQTQKCWGCKVALQTTAAAFKCGWCGAVTDHSLRIEQGRRGSRQLHNVAQRTFTVLVAFLIFIDAAIGICWLLACLTSGVSLRLQQIAGCWAAANILTNFAVCVFGSPGHPHEIISFTHTDQNVQRNQYDNCTYCQQCSFPKPPQAHHCRKCGCCVMDMDHHCFFLNNCVGRNNLKPFLLFLSWMLLGSLYVIICVLILVFERQHEILDHLALPGSGLMLLLWGKRCYYTVIVAQGWMQTCAFLLTTATAAAVGVFALLKSQLSLLLAGKTYISSLRHGQNAAAQQT